MRRSPVCVMPNAPAFPFYIAKAVHGNSGIAWPVICKCAKGGFMKSKVVSFRSNANLARQLWGEPPRIALRALRDLTLRYSLSVAAGDLQFLEGRWYVTHSGLLQLASRKGCRGISTILQERLSDVATGRWVFKATVFKNPLRRDSSATVMPTPQILLRWFVAPKCASLKPGLSIEPCGRPMESACVLLRSWLGYRFSQSNAGTKPVRKAASPERCK